MAEVVVDRLLGGTATFPGADLSTKLKLLGVDVASFGDAFADRRGRAVGRLRRPGAGVYKKLVLSDDARTLLGGVLVGDASAYAALRPLVGRPLGGDPAAWLLPEGARGCRRGPGRAAGRRDGLLLQQRPGRRVAGRVRPRGLHRRRRRSRPAPGPARAAAPCLPLVKKLVTTELEAAGVEVSRALCEHFDVSRAQLFDIVRVSGIRSFSELVARHGRGRGATSASRWSRRSWPAWAPGTCWTASRPRCQDTNDHVMANLQKDGTYSVVPRIPAAR
jgi:nitrite reductase (NADH) large subunit